MSTLMKELLKDVDGVHCHICKEMFSTDHLSPLAPSNTTCGHTVCVSCYQKLLKVNSLGSFNYDCSLCMESSRVLHKTYVCSGFVDFLGEIEQWLETKDDGMPSSSVSPSFNEFLKRFSGMTCYTCKRLMSSDNLSLLAPVKNFCGHHICKECDMEQRKPLLEENDETRWISICVKCSCEFMSSKSQDSVAYGYLSVLSELHTRLLEIWSQRYHKVKCAKCAEEISFDKARTCTTCNEAEGEPSPLCFECLHKYHRRSKHKIVAFASTQKAKIIEESLKTVETLRLTRKRMKSARRGNGQTISSIATSIEKLVELAESSPGIEYYSISKRIRTEIHKFGTTTNDLQTHFRKYTEQLNAIHSNLQSLLPKKSDEHSTKKINVEECE